MTNDTHPGPQANASLLPPPPPPARTAVDTTPPPSPQDWPAVVAEVRRQGDRRTAALLGDGQPNLNGRRIELGLKSPVLVVMTNRAMPVIDEAVRKVFGDGWTVDPYLSATRADS